MQYTLPGLLYLPWVVLGWSPAPPVALAGGYLCGEIPGVTPWCAAELGKHFVSLLSLAPKALGISPSVLLKGVE